MGSTEKLQVKNNKKKVKWSSSKSSVAKISGKGVVTAKKKGKATITAKVAKKKLKCKVTVLAKPKNNTGNKVPSGAVKPVTPSVSKPTTGTTSASGNTQNVSIANGTYKILSAVNIKMGLDASGAGITNETNVQIWQNNGSNQQLFTITAVSGGYYKIVANHSGKVLDVKGGSNKSGTNVQLYDYNGTSAQLWKFVSAGGGYYYIQSKLGTYLDVYGGNSSNGTNVHAYTGNKSTAQKWKLVKYTPSSAVIRNGYYTISTALNSNFVLDVSGGSTDNQANVQIWTNANVNQQKFYLYSKPDGYYTIQAGHSKKNLDVCNGNSVNKTNVWQIADNGTNAQLWRFVSAGNGYYYIQSKLGLYLDVANGAASNGTNVWTYTLNKSNAQRWKLTPTKLVNTPAVTSEIKLNYSYMHSSMRQGDYSTFVVDGANIGCCATAYAIGYSIVDKKNYVPTQFWAGKEAYDPIGRCGAYTNGFNKKEIYDNLKNGKPSLIHYYYAGNSGQHWVTVIGVRAGANPNDLQASDFIVIDPASGTEKKLSECKKFSGGRVIAYKKF